MIFNFKIKSKNNFRLFNKSGTGFTLIELLVVIAIISILSGILSTGINSAKKKAKNVRAIQEFDQIGLAIQMYYDQNNNTWPGTNGPFSALVKSLDPDNPVIQNYDFGNYYYRETIAGYQADDHPVFVPNIYPAWDASWYCPNCKLYFDIVDLSAMTTDDPANFKPDCVFVYIVEGTFIKIGKCVLCLTNECPYCGFFGGIDVQ